MNIAIIGIGGVGGYFGGKLTSILPEEKDINIYFVARGSHLDEIKKNGLILDSDDGRMVCNPTLVTDSIDDLPQLDLCLICVKSYDLENILPQLKPKIADNTMILPLLNGVDIYERIRTTIEKGIVFPSCVYVGTHIEKPGTVKQRGGACTIHFGKDPEDSFVNHRIFDQFEKADIKFNWTENPYTEIWSKFIFIASFGLVTAGHDKTIGEVLQSEVLSGEVTNIMNEINGIAKKLKIFLPLTIVEDSFNKGDKFPFDTKTSFQRDYEIPGKKDERDLFGGTIIRMGKKYKSETKTTERIYDLIQKKKIASKYRSTEVPKYRSTEVLKC